MPSKISTAGYTTEYGNIFGSKLYEKRSRLVLPILIRQANAGQTITYNKLAEEIGMPNPRNLNYPLGTIGGALTALGKEWKARIPPIQTIVINQDTGLPGEGIAEFLPDPDLFVTSRKRVKQQ